MKFVQFDIFDLQLVLRWNFPLNDYLTYFQPFLVCFLEFLTDFVAVYNFNWNIGAFAGKQLLF